VVVFAAVVVAQTPEMPFQQLRKSDNAGVVARVVAAVVFVVVERLSTYFIFLAFVVIDNSFLTSRPLDASLKVKIIQGCVFHRDRSVHTERGNNVFSAQFVHSLVNCQLT